MIRQETFNLFSDHEIGDVLDVLIGLIESDHLGRQKHGEQPDPAIDEVIEHLRHTVEAIQLVKGDYWRLK